MRIAQSDSTGVRLLIGGVTLCFLLAVSAIAMPAAKAATLTVTTLSDTSHGACASECSLRDAISAAGPGDSITFGVTGTILLTHDLPNPTSTLTLIGPAGGITVDGDGLYRSGFVIAPGITVTVRNMTFTRGYKDIQEGAAFYNNGTLVIADSTFSNNSTEAGGGAIYSQSNLSITHTNFISNAASHVDPNDPNLQSVASGGAVYVFTGPAVIATSTFAYNHAPFQGGAIYTYRGAALSIDSSTFYSNTTGYSMSSGGGAIVIFHATLAMTNTTLVDNSGAAGGGLVNWNSTSVVTHTTFSGNTSLFAPGSGGGIRNDAGPVTIQNSILANNAGGNCSPGARVTDGGFNLQFGGGTDNSCGASIPTKDPMLLPLGDYGGPTQTMALGLASPALNLIPPGSNGCGLTVVTDQRGVPRPMGSGCDSGAFEAEYNWLYLPFVRR